MKKLITIILIVTLIVPTVSISEGQDSIIGWWYMCVNLKAYPELANQYENMDAELIIYYFLPTGTIMSLIHDTKDGMGEPRYSVSGKWEKGKDCYSISIIGGGSGKAYIQDNEMIAQIFGENASYALLRKMVEFNPYKDIYRQ